MKSNKNLGKKEIIQILSAYDVGTLKRSKLFTAGSVQTNLLVVTTKGKFVLRVYRNRSRSSITFEIDLINFLKKHRFSCPGIIKNKDKEYISEYKNRMCTIFEFIEGGYIKNPSSKQQNQLIRTVAEMQNILKNYKPIHITSRWNYSPTLCKNLAETEAQKLNTSDAEEKLKWLKKEVIKLRLPKTLPMGICHCDFHYANILFKKGIFNALLDFDDANYTYKIYDLVCLIEPFIFSLKNWQKYTLNDNVFDFTKIKSVVREYDKYRKLSNIEKKYFFDVFKFRILIDCVWYFSRGSADNFYEKRKIDFLNYLGREEFSKRLFTGEKV